MEILARSVGSAAKISPRTFSVCPFWYALAVSTRSLPASGPSPATACAAFAYV
jgi:hypothetical protein